MRIKTTRKRPMQICRLGLGSSVERWYQIAPAYADYLGPQSGFNEILRDFCPSEFHRFTNLHLKPGEGPINVNVIFEVID